MNTRRSMVAGNWKMYGSGAANAALVDGLRQGLAGLGAAAGAVDTLVCPPFVYLAAVAGRLADSGIALGAQNLCAETGQGAYTGEVAGDTLYYQQIAADLATIGVRLETRSRPPTRLLQEVFSGNIGADMFSWNTRGTDPLMDFRHRSCLQAAEARRPFHCDPQLTPLLLEAMNAGDETTRRRHYAAIAAYEREHPPGLFLWQRPDFDAFFVVQRWPAQGAGQVVFGVLPFRAGVEDRVKLVQLGHGL
mgnify:CR=1 FL=1